MFSKTWATSERRYGIVHVANVSIPVSAGFSFDCDVLRPDGSLGSAGSDSALFEETVYDHASGRVLNANMIDYKWRTFAQLPEMKNVVLETLEDPGGDRRELPVQDLYTPLGTVLEPGELLTTVSVPPPADGSRSAFLKFTVREPIDFAVVSVAASITLQEGVCTDARLVLGAIGPRPYRAVEAGARLIGGPIDSVVAAEAKPLRGNGYKVPLVRSLVQRALLDATAK